MLLFEENKSFALRPPWGVYFFFILVLKMRLTNEMVAYMEGARQIKKKTFSLRFYFLLIF